MKLYQRLIIFFLLLLWTAGIFYSCWLDLFNYLIYGYPIVKNTYSLVCHQDPAKLINLSCGNSFVCARCLGIYTGLLINSFLHIFHEIKLKKDFLLVLFATVPMFVDVVSVAAGIYEYSKTLAFITGLLFGSILFLYLYNGLQNLIIEIFKR